jgi:hypothetical protein
MRQIAKLIIAISCMYLLNLSNPQTQMALAYDPHFRLPWASGLSFQILNVSYGYAQGDHFDYPSSGFYDYYALDFGLGTGVSVHAAQGGYATRANHGASDYGKFITIDHGNGYRTIYAHLNDFAITSDGYVTQGQLIGYAGNTGNSQGAHLHFSAKFVDGGGTQHSYMPEPMSGYTGFGNYGIGRGTSPPYMNGAPPSNNLLNSSFETDPVMSSNGGPWQRDSTTNWTTYAGGVTGSRYLEMNTGNQGSGYLWQNIQDPFGSYNNYTTSRTFLNPPDTWTFRVWIRTANCASAIGYLGLRVFDWTASEDTYMPFTATSQWQAFTVTSRFTHTGDGGNPPVHFVLQTSLQMVTPNCNYDFDGASLQRNYINVSSWEESFSPWAMAVPQGCAPAYARYHYSQTSTKDDDYLLQANRNNCASGNVFLYQEVAHYPTTGDTYHARVWVRSSWPNQNVSGYVKLLAFGGTLESQETYWSITANDFAWKEVGVDLTTNNPNHTSLRIELHLNTVSCNGNPCQYDFDGAQVWGGAGN